MRDLPSRTDRLPTGHPGRHKPQGNWTGSYSAAPHHVVYTRRVLVPWDRVGEPLHCFNSRMTEGRWHLWTSKEHDSGPGYLGLNLALATLGKLLSFSEPQFSLPVKGKTIVPTSPSMISRCPSLVRMLGSSENHGCSSRGLSITPKVPLELHPVSTTAGARGCVSSILECWAGSLLRGACPQHTFGGSSLQRLQPRAGGDVIRGEPSRAS